MFGCVVTRSAHRKLVWLPLSELSMKIGQPANQLLDIRVLCAERFGGFVVFLASAG